MTTEQFAIEYADVIPLELNKFGQEASTLRLPPGSWPKSFTTNMGNKQPFVWRLFDRDGSAHYNQQFGCIQLVVWND